MLRSLSCLTVIVAIGFTTAAAAKPRVEMEVLAEPGLNTAAAAQQWTKLLAELGVANVRFHAAQPGQQVGVKASGRGPSAVFHVTAELNARGALVTPGGQFALADRAKLANWLDEIAAAGPENVGQPKTAFGLTVRQLDELRKELARPVGFATKNMPPQKAIEQLYAALKLPLTIEPAIDRALAADDPVRDELQGVSIGTALAAIARPAGAVLAPQAVADQRASGSGVKLRLVAPKEGAESWPIGWPPETKQQRESAPALFELINVDLDVPATQSLEAIQSRLQLPFLFDHNNMVRHRIDLTKPVKIPEARTSYRRILDRLLFQVGMKCELRLDDAGKPLLWVTTLKK